MAETGLEKENRGMVVLPGNALIKEAEESGYALFGMPRGCEYSDYRFIVDLDAVTKNPDGTVSFPLKGDFLRLRANGTKIRIYSSEARNIFSAATADDFAPAKYRMTIPSEAVYDRYPSATRLLMPYDSEYKGCFCSVYNSSVRTTDAGETEVELEDWMRLPVRLKDGTRVRISAKELAEIMEKGKDSYTNGSHWVTVTISKDAILDKHEKQTRLRMPDGKYDGCSYYIPNGMIRDKCDDTVLITLPETRDVYLKTPSGNKIALTAKEFKKLTDRKKSEAYPVANKEDVAQFERKVKEIKEHLPREMVETPDWVDIRMTYGKDGSEYASTTINRVSAVGKTVPENVGHAFAEAEAYGMKHGSSTLGFKFDGDGIVCLSVNGCLDAKGEVSTESAKRLLEAASNTYVERSADGKDMHIFGYMPELKKEHISKDGTMELYSAADFVPVTGDAMTKIKSLEFFAEGSRVGNFIDANFETGKDIAPMTAADTKILERAKNDAESGGVFASLYNGGNPKGTKDFCDENLMMRLSCHAMGDKDAMRRIYNASGREDRTPEHIDHLAQKANRYTEKFVAREKAAQKTALGSERVRDEHSPVKSNSAYKH